MSVCVCVCVCVYMNTLAEKMGEGVAFFGWVGGVACAKRCNDNEKQRKKKKLDKQEDRSKCKNEL